MEKIIATSIVSYPENMHNIVSNAYMHFEDTNTHCIYP